MIKETSKVRLKAYFIQDKSEKESTVNGRDGSSKNGSFQKSLDAKHFATLNYDLINPENKADIQQTLVL